MIKALVVTAALATPQASTAGVLEVGAGGGVITSNGGGEALTKVSAGGALDVGLGFDVRPNTRLYARLLAAFAIEDEQHAHDDVVVACTARLSAGRVWVDGGLGVAFYRGRYRDDGFVEIDAAYDGEIATPTLMLGAGVTVYRAERFELAAQLNLATSPFGGEVAVNMVQLVVGPSWTL